MAREMFFYARQWITTDSNVYVQWNDMENKSILMFPHILLSYELVFCDPKNSKNHDIADMNTVPLSYSNHQPQQNVPHEHDLVVANWKIKQTIQMSFSALTMLILWMYNVADILISLRAKCTYSDQNQTTSQIVEQIFVGTMESFILLI